MKILLTILVYALPLVIAAWFLPKKYVLGTQILVTALFLAVKSPLSLALLTLVTVGNYYLLHKTTFSLATKVGLSLLGLILGIVAAKLWITIDKNVLIPLGLSYYIFRNIHYTLEYYKGKIVHPNVLFYIAYNFFLPVIIVGPIHRYPDFVKDWQRRRFNETYFSLGLERILFGISKIMIISNYLITIRGNVVVNYPLFQNNIWLKSYFELLRYMFNAYFQFAGYSDVAIGIAYLLGYRLMENFNYPFLATNMQAFWTRYHISLSTFCKDYIFMPIAAYTRNAFWGIVGSMIILGLWHEISFRYVLWASVQAVGIYAASWVPWKDPSVITKNMGRLWVIHFFALSCVLISHEKLIDAWKTYKILFFIN